MESYIFGGVWLLSFSIMILTFILVVAFSTSSFLYIVFHCDIHIHDPFFCLRTCGCFQFGAIVIKAAMKIHLCMDSSVSFSLNYFNLLLSRCL